MPPDPSIPLGSYPLDLDILKASLGEPLQYVTLSTPKMQSHDTVQMATVARLVKFGMFAVIKSKALLVTRRSNKHVDFAVHLHPSFTSMYSASVGKSIQTSAKNLESQNVGCTGPMRQAKPPLFTTRYASLMPRCGSGQYSMLPADTYLSNPSVGRGRSSASPYRIACMLMTLYG